MNGQTLLIIRHAEKPEADAGSEAGVDEGGNPDPRSLTPRGWQRAGAWVQLFAPALSQSSALPTPTTLFASAPMKKSEKAAAAAGSKSRRPLETVTPLAAKLGLEIDTRFSKEQETELAAVLAGLQGVAFVCWQHENIAAITAALTPQPRGIPQKWPGDRFNVMFRLDRGASGWTFNQIVPIMLSGDLGTPIQALT